ncbi:MAG: TonB-dependent siderophore receptor [Thermonemataceae bacterium]
MKHLYIILFLSCISITLKAQNSISGTITDETGAALQGATVLLKNTDKGAISNDKGFYQINDVANGTYTLIVKFFGYRSFEQQVAVTSVSLTIDAQLTEQEEALQEVEIVGRSETSYKPDVTFAGTRTGAQVKDVPQSIAVINKEIIRDQGLFRIEEVAANVSGVTKTRDADRFISRGFNVRQDYINGNRALFAPDFSSSSIATQYERVEFIKGPAAALFGNSSPGGVVNAVTKKPLRENRADATISYGSFNTQRATFDITGPIKEDETLLYRMNFAWENAESFRDFQQNRVTLFAPSISYLPDEKTRFNLDIVGTFSDDDAGVDRGMPVLQGDLFALPINFSTAEPYDNRQNSSILLTASGTHEFTEALSINASYTRSDFDQNFLETRSANEFTPDGSELIRTVNDRLTEGSSNFITAYLVAKFNTGIFKHETVLGADYYETSLDIRNRTAIGETNGVPNLVFENRTTFDNLSVLQINLSEFQTTEIIESSYRGAYVQDLITAGKFKILLGLRYEDLDQNTLLGDGFELTGNIDNQVWLPRAGVTYALNNNVNLFVSYTQSFSPQAVPLGVNALDPGQAFDPLTSDQIELGTKSTFFDNRLLAQVSLYTINRTGRLIQDPNSGGGLIRLLQVGDEVSRGVELDFSGSVTENITLTANYAFNEVEVLDDQEGITQLELANNNPQHTASFWGKYTFTTGFLNNLGLGLGARYVSESQVIDTTPGRTVDRLVFEEYFLLNAALFYRYENVSLTANFNNLLDERYFIGGWSSSRVFPGAPRNFLVTLGYSF